MPGGGGSGGHRGAHGRKHPRSSADFSPPGPRGTARRSRPPRPLPPGALRRHATGPGPAGGRAPAAAPALVHRRRAQGAGDAPPGRSGCTQRARGARRRWRGWPPGGCERRSPRPPGGGAPRRRSRTHRRGAGGGSAAPPPRHWPAAALPVAAAAASSSSCSAEARPGRAGPSGALGLLLPSARRGICGPSFRGTRGPGLPPEATPATSSKSQTPSAVGFFYPRF